MISDRKGRKLRGTRTHGRGMKAGRGAGKRGGRGNAGLHKHRYMQILKWDRDHFGRSGFTRPQSMVSSKITMNVAQVQALAPGWVSEGLAEAKGDGFTVDLEALGIDKLLGSGPITVPLTISVDTASSRAIAKVEAAGGSVSLAEVDTLVVEQQEE